MPEGKKKTAGAEKEKSSLDYPSLARQVLEVSGDAAASKLPGGLYVVATPIGNLGDISLRALMTLARADIIACEDTRQSGAMLARFGLKKRLLSYHDHNADERRPEILQHLQAGLAIALISDAGMPLIADPGFRLVGECRKAGFPVTVIPGANAALTALAGAGLPTDRFFFVGFLPPKKAARRKTLVELAAIQATLVFYEAPQRLAETLADLADILGGGRDAAVARELTKLFEETRRGTLEELCGLYDEAPKGEIVILVGPPAEAATAETDIDALLDKHLKDLSLRDAVAAVSAVTGAKKSDVYERALLLKKDK